MTTDDEDNSAPPTTASPGESGTTGLPVPPPPPPVAKDIPGLQKVVSSIQVDHFNTTVYLKGWRLEHSERHPIIIIHDLGEQTNLYRETAYDFAEHGWSVYAFDLRGHGRSGRRLGHAPGFRTLVKDLLQVVAWVRHKENGRTPILLGHGIGALITLEFTKRHGAYCRAAILSAPCLELASGVSWPGRLMLRLLAELSPTIRIPAFLTPRFARDLRYAEMSAADGDEDRVPAYFPRLTAVFAHQLLMAIDRAEARFAEYEGSVLILCPENDTVNLYHRIHKTAALHAQNNLEISDLPGVGHRVFTDRAARRQAMQLILPWLEKALTQPRRRIETAEGRIQGASAMIPQAPPPPPARPGASRD